jgi:hypothetical protein
VRSLIELLGKQFISMSITEINSHILYSPRSWRRKSYVFRFKLEDYIQKRLRQNLETAVLKAHLTLEPFEMQDSTKAVAFRHATQVAQRGFSTLERLFDLLKNTISILGRLATVKSLVSNRAWPILLFSAVLPFANAWLETLDGPHREHPGTYPPTQQF